METIFKVHGGRPKSEHILLAAAACVGGGGAEAVLKT